MLVGTFTGGNVGTLPLVITFQTTASRNAVEAVLRNIRFSNLSDFPSTLPRTVTVTLTDGDGGTSAVVSKTINITARNVAAG